MMRLVLASILILMLGAPSYPDEAKAAYKRGVRAASHKRYDAAYESFQQAYALKPKEPKYVTACFRLRAYAAAQHVSNGLELRDNLELQESLAEFQHAAEIDGTNFVAVQEMRRTAVMIKKQAESGGTAVQAESPLAKLAAEVEGPIDLEPSPDTPISLRIEALRMVALESKTFWRPVSAIAIFVAFEGKRKEFENNVVKTLQREFTRRDKRSNNCLTLCLTQALDR
jgi:general secretion pathway protein D